MCHKGSGGVSHNTLPDVCKTPPYKYLITLIGIYIAIIFIFSQMNHIFQKITTAMKSINPIF
ncbi:hypothetical protein EIU44_21870 [Salmonella enterica]|nr:hypothetical protein [Salmonella enterica subsp. houtenae]EAB2656276.1 hypothetical protein [Salmonella enterica]EBO4456550.1 hypothetical protein [Salmonella enterica]ECE6874170.1 hypothetical protein [Salmonella enterica subsp. houtenae]ECH7619452.1 hypothetical protein [Salmonella enterica]